MEFLDGVTLKQRIAGRPDGGRVDSLAAIEIADALDAAHAKKGDGSASGILSSVEPN